MNRDAIETGPGKLGRALRVPCRCSIGALQNAAAGIGLIYRAEWVSDPVEVDIAFSGSGVKGQWVGRRDRQRADGQRDGMIGSRRPPDSAVGSLPDSAAGSGNVDRVSDRWSRG